MRPVDLPNEDAFPHGTRSRYVVGCRCDECRAANLAAYHELQRKAKEAAIEVHASAAGPQEQTWTAPDGTKKIRVYSRSCPGVNGEPCSVRAHLRKDSTGGICGICRLKLVWNGLVSAAPARRHLIKLSVQGVGYRAVADSCDVGKTTLQEILQGTKTKIRAKSLKEILAVDASAIADHALVPAGPTTKIVEKLLVDGFTRGGISKRIGNKTPALQIKKDYVLAKTAYRIKKLYNLMHTGDDFDDGTVGGLCVLCGRSHKPADRQALIAKMLPAGPKEIIETYPCLYSEDGGYVANSSGYRRLCRDLATLKKGS
jgi:hypothetical protein